MFNGVRQNNIFVDDSCHALLADFGLVSVGDVTAGRMTTIAHEMGTIQWAAPERLNFTTASARQTTAQDVYAFGCLCYSVRALLCAFWESWLKSSQLCAGHQPFHDVRPVYAVIIRVVQGIRPSRLDDANSFGAPCSDDLWTLTERCWHQDPDARPPMAAVLEHLAPLSQPSQHTRETEHLTKQSVLKALSADEDLGAVPTGAMPEYVVRRKILSDIKEFFVLRSLDRGESYFDLPTQYHTWLLTSLIIAATSSLKDAQIVADLFVRIVEKAICSIDTFELAFTHVVERLDGVIAEDPQTVSFIAILMRGAGLDKDKERRARIARKSVHGHARLRRLLSSWEWAERRI